MSDFTRKLLLLLLVVSAAVGLCLFVPALILLELFLVLSGGIVIAVGISLLDDLIHYHKVGQRLREIELEREKRQLRLLNHSRVDTSHCRNQGRLRRLRGGRCR